MTDDEWLHDVLSDEECHRLLETASVGHLAYTDGALPAILPVRYALHDRRVVVATRRDGSLAAALRGAVVAFGIDSWNGELRTGWGVTVVGPALIVSRPAEVRLLDEVTAPGLHRSEQSCYVAIRAELVRGWRTTVPLPDPVPGPA